MHHARVALCTVIGHIIVRCLSLAEKASGTTEVMSDRIRPGYHRINGIYVYYIYIYARSRAHTHYDFAKFIPASSYPMRNNLRIYDKTILRIVLSGKNNGLVHPPETCVANGEIESRGYQKTLLRNTVSSCTRGVQQPTLHIPRQHENSR